MSKFKFTFVYGDSNRARMKVVTAESEGEAVELFDEWAYGLDDFVDVISVVEVSENDV